MKMEPKDIRKHELIGLQCEIVNATNKSLIGCKGKIVDETRNTLIIDCDNHSKTILKEQVTLNLHIGENIIQIEGKTLVARPHERLKK